MTDPSPSAAVANAHRFVRLGAVADAVTAGQIRDDFARWLRTFFDLDPYRSSDLVLAINEAMANSAEHAYPSAGRTGTTDVEATYDPAEGALVVTVVDHGLWRTTPSIPGDRNRGRGIALMKALSDRASIQTSTVGTLVSLAWTGVHQRAA